MEYKPIESVLSRTITGEWGEDVKSGKGVRIIRTTNFTNSGKLDLKNVAIREVNDKVVQDKKLRYGDIILEKSGGSDNFAVGRVVYFDIRSQEEYLCNNFTQILRANQELANPKYLFYYLLYFHKNGSTRNLQNKTTGIRNLQVKRYLAQKVPVPSIASQHKIALILEKAESAKEKRKEADRLTNEFLKSAFLEMFGDPVKNPKKWGIGILKDIIKIDRNNILPGAIENRTKYIGLEHIESETGKLLNYEEVVPEQIKSTKFVFSTKHVLLGKLRPYLNKVVLPDFNGICSTDILPLLPEEKKADKYFIAYLLRHRSFVDYATGRSAGANLPRINPRTVEEFRAYVPPLSLQQKFADLVQKVEKLKEKQQESGKELDNLFNSLMQKAFKGII